MRFCAMKVSRLLGADQGQTIAHSITPYLLNCPLMLPQVALSDSPIPCCEYAIRRAVNSLLSRGRPARPPSFPCTSRSRRDIISSHSQS